MISQESLYDADTHVPEIYDAQITNTEDLSLIRSLLGTSRPLRILEPFCGTGRLSIPLAQEGHHIIGLDSSKWMLRKAEGKIKLLELPQGAYCTFHCMNVLVGEWPSDVNVVLLGGNCLYELATAEDQRQCIHKAYIALRPGGYIYLDNDHMEGLLAESWKDPIPLECFPSGICDDGTVLKSTRQTVWYDERARLARFMRVSRVTLPDGSLLSTECMQQKHPPSIAEMESWLLESGFSIVTCYGGYDRISCESDSPRAIFWGRKL